MLDKDWVHLSRADPAYVRGASNFVRDVAASLGDVDLIICPCIDCRNIDRHSKSVVVDHLVIRGMDEAYKLESAWYHHEELNSAVEGDSDNKFSEWNDEIFRLYEAADEFMAEEFGNMADLGDSGEGEEKKEDDFLAKLADAETPLYPSCVNHSKLLAIVTLFRIKSQNGWSDKSFNDLLETLSKMLPKDNVLHKSLYEVKKFLKSFDMGYQKIHACVNDCCLFRKKYKTLDKCPKCKTSRWKTNMQTGEVKKGVPQKVLRYFPIIPRLKRMFRSEKMAKDLRWHFTNKSSDGKLRHPVDSVTWDHMNDKYPSFAAEERSVNKGSQPKCVLIDWAGDYANVAEGRIISSDPNDMVNNSPLGPNDLKVLVETATVPEASLWRPAHQIFTIEDAVGHMIAWPAKKCVNLEQELQQDDIATLGTRTDSLNKCKLLDLSNDDVVVAEGRWLSKDPKALVNGLPIGPKAVKVFVDEVHQSETFIWRATMEVSYLEDCLLSFVAWPYCKVLFENTDTNGACQKASVHKSASVDQSGGKSASAVLKATATGEKSSHIDTTTATCQKSAATKSGQKSAATSKEKSTAATLKSGEKSLTKGSKSPATEIELASQSPLRRSPRKNIGGGIKENQKCKLMDITGKKRVVAEGRVYKTDPEHTVHNAPVGPNGVSVWIDKVKVDDAAVWKPSDEIAFVKDSLGLPLAWPINKLVVY